MSEAIMRCAFWKRQCSGDQLTVIPISSGKLLILFAWLGGRWGKRQPELSRYWRRIYTRKRAAHRCVQSLSQLWMFLNRL